MGKEPNKTVLSFHWLWRSLATFTLFVVVAVLIIVVKQFLPKEPDWEWWLWSGICVLLIAIVSGMASAVVTLLTAGQAISRAQESVHKNIAGLNEQVEQFEGISTKITKQLKEASRLVDLLGNEITRAREIARIALKAIGSSIIHYKALMDIESSIRENGAIWVLTSALELEEDELKNIIQTNFRKGVQYTYLIPKEDGHLKTKMRRLASEWQQYCKSPDEQIRCLLVPKHFAYMTVLVYGPSENKPTVLVKFPKSDVYEKEKYPFIYRVDEEPEEGWKAFVNALEELIDVNKRCASVEPLEFDFT